MPTRLSVLGVRIPEQAIQTRRILPVAVLLTGGLAAVESHLKLDFSLGVLYTLPVLAAATVLTRWQIVLFALGAALVRAPFTPASSALEALLKFAMASLAYIGTGLLIVEVSNNRRRIIDMLARVQREQDLRRHAEEQLRMLADSSPAAILTLNADGAVLAANRSAHVMLGVPAGSLPGRSVEHSLPMCAQALRAASHDRAVRTSVAGWARRDDGHVFPIQAWISVYGAGSQRCLAAIVVDTSEEVRDREREHFQHLLDYNRLLASAVSHEIRNLCAALFVVCSNLRDRAGLSGHPDFEALVRLVDGLRELASLELRTTASEERPAASLPAVLDQLRLVIEPDWEDVGGSVAWSVPGTLPEVAASAHGLMQIFLNLAQNSLRAVADAKERHLRIAARHERDDVVLTFTDTGTGVPDPERLFHLHPVKAGDSGSGLGLYISRELARSMGGDLTYVPTPQGAEFRVIVPAVRRPASAVPSASHAR